MTTMIATFGVALALAQAEPDAPRPQAPAQDAKAAEAAAALTPRERLAALQKEFDDAQTSFSEKYGAAKTDEERQKLFESDYPRPERFVPRFLALAREAKGDRVALDAYVWVLQRGQPADKAPAYAALLEDHAESPDLVPAVQTVGRYETTIAAERFVRGVLERSPHHEVKGNATYALAGLLVGLASLHDTMSSPDFAPEHRAMSEQYYGKETLEELAARDAQEMRDEAEDLLEDVTTDYAGVKHYRGTLGSAAAGDLFEVRHLAIGKVAPEIEGEDVDGVRFKLSDYRGKVVVLDFWGFW